MTRIVEHQVETTEPASLPAIQIAEGEHGRRSRSNADAIIESPGDAKNTSGSRNLFYENPYAVPFPRTAVLRKIPEGHPRVREAVEQEQK